MEPKQITATRINDYFKRVDARSSDLTDPDNEQSTPANNLESLHPKEQSLTGREMVDRGIVTPGEGLHVIHDDNIQQHGVDLNLIEVYKIETPGFIPVTGKTVLGDRVKMEPVLVKTHQQEFDNIKGINPEAEVWVLEPGMYEITFAQGCNIPNYARLQIVQRSSCMRNGTIIRSSLFDAGFTTTRIGTAMMVGSTIFIERGARIAQAYVDMSNKVENLYDGQFQNDKQRQ